LAKATVIWSSPPCPLKVNSVPNTGTAGPPLSTNWTTPPAVFESVSLSLPAASPSTTVLPEVKFAGLSASTSLKSTGFRAPTATEPVAPVGAK
jgi:hypothetical protein